ncbi:anti-repressor SinI family protein [Halobacillus sp. A5]|nr:anti-repressor SinI family protein [Halobacillus sp. A5]MCP3028088.1 anti-repressor SinI family protein [Halobacillus sp. A5]
MKKLDCVKKLDTDWVALMKEAKQQGLTKEEIHQFLSLSKQINSKDRV